MAHPAPHHTHPRRCAPVEAWAFEVPGTGQVGWFPGSLPRAARSALSLAWASRRAGVVLTLPRAGRFGLLPLRYIITDPQDTHQLLRVDVERLQARHPAQRRRQLHGGWREVLRAWAVARMPRAAIERH